MILTILISTVFLEQKVNASEISANVSYLDEEYFTITSNNTFYNSLDYYVFTLTGDNVSHRIQVNLDNPINTSNFDYIQLNYIASGGFSTNNNTNTNNLNYNYCKVWTKSSQNDSYICTQFKEDTDEFIIQNDTISYYNLSNFINVYAVTNEGNRLNCSVNGNNILCPTNNKTITQFTFDYAFNGNNSQVKFYFYGRYSKFTSETNKINNSINKVDETLKQNHEYNNNASKDTTAQENEINNYEQKEDSLRNSLNLDIEDSEITINPEANNFIWETINKLRGMSNKIVLLFTSVLSLGLMKMILGR